MGVLRSRIHRTLRAADCQARYRLYCPMLPWLAQGDGCLNVHSKVLIIDEALLSVGSSNLSDRSLGIDTECNLTIESRGEPRLQALIAGLRERLLAEHLGCAADDVAKSMAREGSLHRAIDALARDGARTLLAVEPKFDPALDALVPDHHVLDPEQPLDADTIVADRRSSREGSSDARCAVRGGGGRSRSSTSGT